MFRHWLAYIAFWSILVFIKLVPFRLCKYLAYILAGLTKNIFRYRRKTVDQNIKRSFPNLKKTEIKQITDKFYIHFSMLWIELLKGWGMGEEFFRKHLHVNDGRLVNKLVSGEKGVIFVSGHLGVYEWLALALPLYKKNVTAIMKKLSNPKIDQKIIQMRSIFGCRLIYQKQALKEGIKILKENGWFLMIADQDARKQGIFVDFLGVPASSAKGPAMFHKRTDSKIVFATIIRKKWGEYEFIFEELELNDQETTIESVTQLHTRVLEKYIRQYPDQYFWSHKRWKTKPAA